MRDLVTLLVVLALAAGAGFAFFNWKAETARAEEARYEAGLDQMVDAKLTSVRLGGLRDELAAHREARLEALRALYAIPTRSDQLNLGFGTLRGDWAASYAHYAEQAGRDVDNNDGRLRAEVDERFGEGAYALMGERYQAFLADMPRRTAAEDARWRSRTREMMDALDDYYRRNGRYPYGDFRVENGRVVEAETLTP